MYEPFERVRIQAASPTPLKSNYSIDHIDIQSTVINDDLSLRAVALDLNDGLVAVTGGRGSGKTAFVDLIANSYIDRARSDDPNSFVRRIFDDHPKLPIRLSFKNGETFEKIVGDTIFFDRTDVVYIAQGELEGYVGNASDLNQYINGLVFDSSHIKNSVTAFEYLTLSDKVDEAEQHVADLNIEIDDLERQTSADNLAAVEKSDRRVVAELQDVVMRIEEYEKKISPPERTAATQRQQALTKLQQEKTKLLNLARSVNQVLELLNSYVKDLSPAITHINQLAAELGITNIVLQQPVYSGTDTLIMAKGMVDTRIHDVVGKVEKAQRDLDTLEADLRDHASMLAGKERLQTRIDTYRDQIRNVRARRDLLSERRSSRNIAFTNLIRNILSVRDKYRDVISSFGTEKNDVLADIEFVAEIIFDETRLLREAEVILDNRQVEVFGSERSPSIFKTMIDLYRRVVTGDDDIVEDLVTEVARLAEETRTKIKRAKSISSVNLYRCLYGRYLSVRPSVRYKKTALSRLSLGQKATVLIKIYLAEGTKPIIVDSHDDHLDNEFIMDELVGAIRQAKRFRQVILASNNGNVVINSDAEQVILAENTEGEISYLAGSLENHEVRDRALRVLEGGADAFRKRQEKYRLTGGR